MNIDPATSAAAENGLKNYKTRHRWTLAPDEKSAGCMAPQGNGQKGKFRCKQQKRGI
jgi:hypothetical protein